MMLKKNKGEGFKRERFREIYRIINVNGNGRPWSCSLLVVVGVAEMFGVALIIPDGTCP